MKKKAIIILNLLFAISLAVKSQELIVKNLELATTDLSASIHERRDLNDDPCALVKVRLAHQDAEFKGNIMGDIEFKSGEYWVYLAKGSYKLGVHLDGFLPLDVNFREVLSDFRGVEPKTTYILTILLQQEEEKLQELTIHYSPSSAMVMIDDEPYEGTDGIVKATLPVGMHEWRVVAMGYHTRHGTELLNEEAPSMVVVSLVQKNGDNSTSGRSSSSTPQVPDAEYLPTLAANPSDTLRFIVNGVMFRMIRVAAGSFKMGDKNGRNDAKHVHEVQLSPFAIGETEVTQALWLAVMGGKNPSKFKDMEKPIEKVSWDDCQEFIWKLNELTGRDFRFPTEAEWEYAARGGKKAQPTIYSGSDDVDEVAWVRNNTKKNKSLNNQMGNSVGSKGADDIFAPFSSNSTKKKEKEYIGTHKPGEKKANELGIYDMSGNVWEWCSDWYGENYYKASPIEAPSGPNEGENRVKRGGSWTDSVEDCLIYHRESDEPNTTKSDIGLRLALTIRRNVIYLDGQ